MTTSETSTKKSFVLKISELIGEYEASAKVLVQVEPGNLDQYVADLLLNDWRGEGEFNEDDQVYENGETSWHLVEAIQIDDDIADYLIKMNILNIL
jgi:hypothetical protein